VQTGPYYERGALVKKTKNPETRDKAAKIGDLEPKKNPEGGMFVNGQPEVNKPSVVKVDTPAITKTR